MAVRLDIRHLVMIETIALTESLSAAARAMHITQSALSHRIREAERRVGAQLIGKRNGRAFLTTAGRLLLPVAQSTLIELELAERAIDTFSNRTGAVVRIFASALIGYQWLPLLVADLAERKCDVQLQVVGDQQLDPMAMLKAKLVDLVIVPATSDAAFFSFTSLFEDELVGVLAADHPKAGFPHLTPEDFRDETYMGNSAKREAGHVYERFFEASGIMPRRILHVGTAETCAAFVCAGMGVTILTRLAARHYAHLLGLKMVPLWETGLPIQWYAVVRHDEANTLAGTVAAHLRALASTICLHGTT